jgi:hypothetical protein
MLRLYEWHRLENTCTNISYVDSEAIQDSAERTGDFVQAIQKKATNIEIKIK